MHCRDMMKSMKYNVKGENRRGAEDVAQVGGR